MTRLGAAVVLAVDGAAGAGVGAAVAAGGAGAVTVGVEPGTVPVGSATVHSFTPPWRVQAPLRCSPDQPDTMPQAIQVSDRQRRSCTFVPVLEEDAEEKRPQDPDQDGSALAFTVLEYGGEYLDAMPQLLEVRDEAGRCCLYEPIRVNGKVVDSKGVTLERLD